MDLQAYCPEKVVTADVALSKIKNGSRIFIGTACGEPQHLIHSLVGSSFLQDAVIYQMLSITLSKYVDDPNFSRRFALKLFFISASMRKAAFEGRIDYLPAYLSQIPNMFASRRIGLDVAIEALREGWQQRRFTLDELDSMARICRVQAVMRPYVEALVA